MFSRVYDMPCAENKHSMMPFHSNFSIQLYSGDWFWSFLSLAQMQSNSDLPYWLQIMLTIYAAAEAQAIFQTPFAHTQGPSAQVMIDGIALAAQD